MNTTSARYFDFGGFRLDTTEQALFRNGERVPMTLRSFQLLQTLVSRSGQLVRHDDLMREVWQDASVDPSSIKQTIALVRKALGDGGGGEDARFIQTVPKFGYRFIAPVTPLPDENIAFIAERRRVTNIEIVEQSTRVEPQAENRGRVLRFAYLAFAAVGLTAAIVAAWIFARNSRPSLPTTSAQTFAMEDMVPSRVTDSGDIANGILSPDGGFIAYSNNDDGKHSSLFVRPVGSRAAVRLVTLDIPEAFGAYSFTNDGKWIYYVATKNGDWGARASLYRVSILGGTPRRILDYIDSFVSFAPDDSRLVFNRFTKEGCQLVTASALDGSGERVIAQGRTNLEFLEPKWSPDGSEIIYFSYDRRTEGTFWQLGAIEAEGGRTSVVRQSSRQRIWHIALTPTGDVVLNATDQATRLPQLYVVSRKSGETRRLTNDLFYYTGVSVGGNSILSTKQDRPSYVSIVDLSSPASMAAPKQILDGTMFDTITWTPDGKRLVMDAADAGRRHLWTMNEDGSDRQMISVEKADELLPAVSPDGKSIVCMSSRAGTYEVWVSDLDGGHSRQLTSGNSWAWQVRFSADGKWIYYGTKRDDGAVQLARVPFEGGDPQIVFADVNMQFFDVSPDGRTLAYATYDQYSGDSSVVLRDIETGTVSKTFNLAITRMLHFTPDGRDLMFKYFETGAAPASSIWLQPIDGGKPRLLVDLKSDDVFGADLSPDGKRLATVRGRLTSDLILLTNATPGR